MKEIMGFKSDAELARHLNLEQNTVASWRSRPNIPYDVLFRFCLANDVDPIRLAGGKASSKYAEIENQEDRCVTAPLEADTQVQSVKELIRERDELLEEVRQLVIAERWDTWIKDKEEDTGVAAVPVYDAEIERRSGVADRSEMAIDYMPIKKTWVSNNLKTKPSALAIYRVSDDFMEPTLRKGDFVLVDTKCSVPRDGGIYVVRFAGMTTCRRVQVMKDRTIRAKADNSLYEPISVDLEKEKEVEDKDKEVVFVGRVIWVAKKVG
jgi:phage repressor protein C with HTH and peptisase S24 domain